MLVWDLIICRNNAVQLEILCLYVSSHLLRNNGSLWSNQLVGDLSLSTPDNKNDADIATLGPHATEGGIGALKSVPCEYSCDDHYSDVIMSAMASQITAVSMVLSTACSSADQRKHQSSASLAFARGIHRWPVNSPHKGPVTRKMFPFNDVIMTLSLGTFILMRFQLWCKYGLHFNRCQINRSCHLCYRDIVKDVPSEHKTVFTKLQKSHH